MLPIALALCLGAQGVPIELTSNPSWARVYAIDDDKAVRVGRTPLKKTLAPGTVLEVRYRGRDPERIVVEEGDRTKHVCLDMPGQVLKCDRVLRTGLRPKSVAFRPASNELWVALFAGPALQVFDLESGKRTHNIRAGKDGAVEMVFTNDGATVYASQLELGRVLEVDAATKRVKRKMPVRGTWPKVLVLDEDNQKLYASNWRSSNVSELDLKTGKVARRFKTTKVPRGLYIHDGHLFVAGYYRGHLDVVDLKSGEVETVYKDGDSLRHIAGHGERVLVSDMGTYEVLEVDADSHEVKQLARTEPNPNTIALSPDGKLLFVSSRGKNAGKKQRSWLKAGPTWGSLLVYDASTGEKLDAVVTGNQTTGLAVSPDGKRVAVTDFLDNRVRVHRVPSLEKLRAGPGRLKVYRRELKKRDYVEVESD